MHATAPHPAAAAAPSRRLRCAGAALCCAAPVATAAVLVANPSVHVPLCLARSAFGVPCPVCGMTTSVTATLRGDLGGAFSAAPLGPVAVALLLVAVAGFAFWAVRGVAPAPMRALGALVQRAPRTWAITVPLVLLAAAWAYQLALGPYRVL